MVEILQFGSKQEIREEASQWVLRLDDPEIDEQTLESFLTWIEASPQHRQEFIEIASVWGNLDTLSELAGVIPLEELNLRPEKKPDQFNFNFQNKLILVTSICFVLITGIYLVNNREENQTPNASISTFAYSTLVGEQDHFSLPDGSFVSLNTNSSIKVDYTETSRTVRLKYGEAYFQIKHDPARTFTVLVGNGSVTAIGTAFNIQYDEKFVDVTVTDGVVEVNTDLVINTEKSLQKKVKTSLSAGEVIRFNEESHEVMTIVAEEMDQDLAWQRGMLIFDGDRLEEVVHEIGRYTNTKIIIDDQAIRNVQVGGYFKAGEIEAMLRVFESSFGIAVNRINEDVIVLSKKPDFSTE